MKRYVKVLAAGSLVGLQGLPGYVAVAAAQNVLEPVTVTGSSTGGSSCWPNCTAYSGGGGNSSSGGGSIPENEAFNRPPAPPPPRTPEEKKRDCDRADETRKKATEIWATAVMTSCVQYPISAQAAAAVKSVLAGVAISSIVQPEIRMCLDRNYPDIVKKMDENTVEYNRCMSNP